MGGRSCDGVDPLASLAGGGIAERRFPSVLAAASLQRLLSAQLIDGLPSGHRDQQGPQFIAVAEVWKPPLLHPREEAVHHAQDNVFLVANTLGRTTQLLPGKQDQPLEVRLPQMRTRRLVTPILDAVEPDGDLLGMGWLGRHQQYQG
ncbi:MAG: hypothetical protein AAGJ46_04390 [Planctomycetota bacterium]